VVAGDNLYTTMIQSLLLLADCQNDVSDRIEVTSDQEVDLWTSCWMKNRAPHSPKNVEDKCLLSLMAYVMNFENHSSIVWIQAELEGHGFCCFAYDTRVVWYIGLFQCGVLTSRELGDCH
jgi:hypothetical protein